jgi:hypothetical protein
MSELMATLKAVYEREHRNNKFIAAMQGIDIDKDKKGEEGAVTFEEVKARAIAKATGDTNQANAARFGIDQMDGTGYKVIGL